MTDTMRSTWAWNQRTPPHHEVGADVEVTWHWVVLLDGALLPAEPVVALAVALFGWLP